MSGRVTSDLLLVGSLPADSAETALRAGGELFGDMVASLPDGETGPRAAWVGYERERLLRPHPDVEAVQETGSPTGIPRHVYDTPVFKIREGVTELRWESWPRVDDALESYALFTQLRQEGVIPKHVRFQVSLPFPSATRRTRVTSTPRATRGLLTDAVRRASTSTAACPQAAPAAFGRSCHRVQQSCADVAHPWLLVMPP
jgi:hypothetical protein